MRVSKRFKQAPRLASALHALLFAACILGFAVNALAEDSSVSEEFKIKAAFVYNFLRFTDWPSAPASSPDRSTTICIVGQNFFGNTLGEIIDSGDIRNVRVVFAASSPVTPDCNIAVINGSDDRLTKSLLDSFKAKSTLTVSDMVGFSSSGGIIEFALKDGKVRFYIDEAKASSVGLTISSKLSALALR